MTWLERFWRWWATPSRVDHDPPVSAHTAHREHEAHLHALADRARRRSNLPPAMTGNARDLLEPDYDKSRERFPRPPKLPR